MTYDHSSPIDDAKIMTLSNGMRFVSVTMPHTQAVTSAIFVKAGSRWEPAKNAGIAHFLEHMVFKGTKRWPSSRHISEAIEGVGGNMNASTGKELVTYWTRVPVTNFELGTSVVSALVNEPLIEPQEAEKERNVILEELDRSQDDPHSAVGLLSDEITFGDQPLGRPIIGSRETLLATAGCDIRHYMETNYVPENTVIAVVGRAEHEKAYEIVEKEFGTWKQTGSNSASYTSCDTFPTDQGVIVEDRGTEQANLVLTAPGLSLEDPDRWALALLNAVLGEGMSSRLFLRIREQMALAYSVYSYSYPLTDQGVFGVYAGVSPDRAEDAVRAIVTELSSVGEDLEQEELDRAREYVRGRLILGTEDTRGVVSWVGGQLALMDRVIPMSEVIGNIESVSLKDITRVADKVLDASRYRLAVLGAFEDDSGFRDALAG